MASGVMSLTLSALVEFAANVNSKANGDDDGEAVNAGVRNGFHNIEKSGHHNAETAASPAPASPPTNMCAPLDA